MATHETTRPAEPPTFAETERTARPQDTLESIFTSPWEQLVERLVEGDLVPLLKARGIVVEGTHQRHRGRRNGEYFEPRSFGWEGG